MLLRVANIVPVPIGPASSSWRSGESGPCRAPRIGHFECTHTQTPDAQWRRETQVGGYSVEQGSVRLPFHSRCPYLAWWAAA